jgi:type I restriction enzyme S subunit
LLAKTKAAIARLTEYRQALITSAVTGKIDVRGLA